MTDQTDTETESDTTTASALVAPGDTHAVPSHELPTLEARVRRLMVFAFAVVALIAVLTGFAFVRLLDARSHILDELDPMALSSSELLAALVDQDTAVRGYVTSGGAEAFLEPYERGRADAAQSRAAVHDLIGTHPSLGDELAAIDAAVGRWQDRFAAPTIDSDPDPESAAADAALEEGRLLFADVRAAFDGFNDTAESLRSAAREDLNRATLTLLVAIIALAVMSVSSKVVLWRTFRRSVAEPLRDLGDDASAVAEGDLRLAIRRPDHMELAELGESMEMMRQRLVDELGTLEETYAVLETQAEELERSNSDLEQFAYVASHDLQEPLRKVISFSQLLQSRYEGQLDERADQYIGFAVDAAKRMQVLINDLLAFSRVGRFSGDPVDVDLGEAVDSALDNLSMALSDTGAVIEREPLPTVEGDPALLVSLFQNLIGNAIKFRREDVVPRVSVEVRTAEDEHVVSVTDNGIGIDPQFEERVFVIFQRLHGKDAYGGTGIGLAMCRKIVEHHGGRIWIDPFEGPGTRFCISFPLPEEPSHERLTDAPDADTAPPPSEPPAEDEPTRATAGRPADANDDTHEDVVT